ncbi:MAG: hypothetical protein ACK6DK_14240 [Gemmatimonadota bacterium]
MPPARGRTAPVLDRAFGAPSRVRLLRVFAFAPAPLPGRGAGRAAGLAHRPAVRALGTLVALGLLRVRRGGAAHQYELETRHPLAKRLRRLYEREAEGR